MTLSNGGEDSLQGGGSATPGPAAHRSPRERHDEAVIQAEVRRLAQALRPFGVLSRDALERAAGAEHWHEGGFDGALSEAVKTGAIERRPLGFYSAPRTSEHFGASPRP